MKKKNAKWEDEAIEAIFSVKKSKKKIAISVRPKIKDGWSGQVDDLNLFCFGTACIKASINALEDYFMEMDERDFIEFSKNILKMKCGEERGARLLFHLAGAAGYKVVSNV